MKKVLFLLTAILLLLVLVACQEASVTTQPQVTTSPVASVDADTTAKKPLLGIPTVVDVYAVQHAASPSGRDIDAYPVFSLPLPTPGDEFIVNTKTSGIYLSGTKLDFLGTLQSATLESAGTKFPLYPREYGAFSEYSYRLSGDEHAKIHIRHDTKQPIAIFGRHGSAFSSLDMTDKTAVLITATEWLAYYGASIDGCKIFIYEETLNQREGISVEYNRTVGGVKSAYYSKMWISLDGKDYDIRLKNEIEAPLGQYASYTIDEARVKAIIDEEAGRYYGANENFYLDSYQFALMYIVQDGKLFAHVKVSPKIYMTEQGLKTYEQSGEDGPVSVVATDLYLLITVAEIRYLS